MSSRISKFVEELCVFGYNQARASVFGGALLVSIICVAFFSAHLPLHTYDILFVVAVLIQAFLILGRHESISEVKVIFVFHIIATIMELFKTHPAIGSWSYSEGDAFFQIAYVPLFVGFLYSSVGSYIARAWRIFRLSFTHFPPLTPLILVATGIYLNFFAHHFFWDLRYILLLCVIVLFWKTRVHYMLVKTQRSMPLLLGFALVTFFLYVAENIGTYFHMWTYPTQELVWQMVPLSKYGSWFLLMIVSFTLVALIYRDKIYTISK